MGTTHRSGIMYELVPIVDDGSSQVQSEKPSIPEGTARCGHHTRLAIMCFALGLLVLGLTFSYL